MRTKGLIIITLGMSLIIGLLTLQGRANSTKSQLKQLMRSVDPDTMIHERQSANKDSSSLDDGAEVGVLKLKDGSRAKFWFWSHHLTDDMGGTWFQMSDGTDMYMAGAFCCEVMPSQDAMQSLETLKAYIKKWHGTWP